MKPRTVILIGAIASSHRSHGVGVAWWARLGGFVVGMALAHFTRLFARPRSPDRPSDR